MKANILEIFRSIQGEGKYAGVRQIFVRFFECNMHCVWCDTPASIGDTSRNYKEFSLEEVFNQITKLWNNCHSVSLTGGEPLLQKDFIKKLLPLMRKKRMTSYLETNGVCYDELKTIIDEIDIISMDIKMPSSTKLKSYWEEHKKFLKVASAKEVFIKAVVSSDTDQKDMERTTELIAEVNPQLEFIIQLNTFELKNGVMKKCLEFHEYCLKYLPNARVLPQVHKFMKL